MTVSAYDAYDGMVLAFHEQRWDAAYQLSGALLAWAGAGTGPAHRWFNEKRRAVALEVAARSRSEIEQDIEERRQ